MSLQWVFKERESIREESSLILYSIISHVKIRNWNYVINKIKFIVNMTIKNILSVTTTIAGKMPRLSEGNFIGIYH